MVHWIYSHHIGLGLGVVGFGVVLLLFGLLAKRYQTKRRQKSPAKSDFFDGLLSVLLFSFVALAIAAWIGGILIMANQTTPHF